MELIGGKGKRKKLIIVHYSSFIVNGNYSKIFQRLQRKAAMAVC